MQWQIWPVDYEIEHPVTHNTDTEHKRTSSYIDNTTRTLANIIDNFKTGEVYNIAGSELHVMKQVSDIILKYLGKDDSLVEYKDRQDDTTLLKIADYSKAVRDLGHENTVSLEEGIPRTIDWQKEVYGIG